ncbi:hypothetical protein [Chryseobacterium sp.]|uniref:hypothetical protein n=1 Tax=Chryseobacterium sp. TaxID=1871047 RepID=UPI0035B38C59
MFPGTSYKKTKILKKGNLLKELKDEVRILLKIKTAIIKSMIAVYCSEDGSID